MFIRYHGNHKSPFKLKTLLFKVKRFASFAHVLVQGLCYVKYDSGDFIYSVRNILTALLKILDTPVQVVS